MLIYHIRLDDNAAAILGNHADEVELKMIEMDRYGPDAGLLCDDDFMFNEYGFLLSPFERDQFYTHYNVWKQFKESMADYCLIIQSTTGVQQPLAEVIAQLKPVFTENISWDVFFPFDQVIPEDFGDMEHGYLLGCYWGLDVYCVSRKGVDVLLKQIKKMSQPLDEEILSLSMEEKVEIFYEETNLFVRYENLHRLSERAASVKKAIFGANAWSAVSKEMVRGILKKISETAVNGGVELLLCFGSLLGQVRHDGIMPWDDDVDLAIEEGKYEAFLAMLQQETDLKASVFYWGMDRVPHCKIWQDSGEEIPGCSYKFPFVDLWFYENTEDQVIFNVGGTFAKSSFFPSLAVDFEGCLFKAPRQSLAYLDATYPSWRTKIELFAYCHRLERIAFNPLSTAISVDEEGRLSS